MLIDFCLPIKNEAAILRGNLDKLLSYCHRFDAIFTWRIIGIINGSQDDSAAIFQEFKDRFPKIVDYLVIAEAGRGRALKKYWGEGAADILVYMDADLAVSLDNIPALINPLLRDESDLVIGSRFLKGAKVQRSLNRELISRAYSFISRCLLNHSIADSQCGFKAIRREVFHKLKPFLRDNYWFFDTELILLAKYFGYRIKEIPVDWQENRYGQHKSTVKIIADSWQFLKNIMIFRRRLKELKKHSGNV